MACDSLLWNRWPQHFTVLSFFPPLTTPSSSLTSPLFSVGVAVDAQGRGARHVQHQHQLSGQVPGEMASPPRLSFRFISALSLSCVSIRGSFPSLIRFGARFSSFGGGWGGARQEAAGSQRSPA